MTSIYSLPVIIMCLKIRDLKIQGWRARTGTRPQGINNTGNPPRGVGMAQNQPPLHYPAMLNPCPIYQNPVPGAGDHHRFEPDRDSASPTPSEFSNRSDDRNKRSSWSLTEERCSTWITAYEEYYDRLRSTKSSQGKKNTWEDILKQFQSMCFDIEVEFEKLLAQLKERWRALLGKYKSVCDNNNPKGSERKTFKHHEDIDEFMASSGKVNPRFVNETKAHKQDYSSNDTDDIVSTGNQDCGKKPEKRPVTLLRAIVRLQRKLEKMGKRTRRKREKAQRRWHGASYPSNDEVTKNPSKEVQRQHQDFFVFVLGKLGDVSASKNKFQLSASIPKKKKGNSLRLQKDILNDLEYHFGHWNTQCCKMVTTATNLL